MDSPSTVPISSLDNGEETSMDHLSEKIGGLSVVTEAQDPEGPSFNSAAPIIAQYLNERDSEYRRLSLLRKKGWENPAGDAFFRKQRQTADNANEKTSRVFYELMKAIARDVHKATKAFKISPKIVSGQPRILDMCMAPGGFLATALDKNPTARVLGFSLPISQGGHKTLLPDNHNVELRYLDINMLAEDMGVEDIPPDHPESDKFLPRQFHSDETFDLAFCDGQVLRTHQRAEYRERTESRRLTTVQLALALEHLTPGGTMVVLLHKVEFWNTVLILREFSRFSKVRVFKPSRGHAKRSSFYMVASNVQTQHKDALVAVEGWKKVWRLSTLQLNDEWADYMRTEVPDPQEVLQDFGEELVRLGRKIWEIQADALERAPFTK